VAYCPRQLSQLLGPAVRAALSAAELVSGSPGLGEPRRGIRRGFEAEGSQTRRSGAEMPQRRVTGFVLVDVPAAVVDVALDDSLATP
jgi:hypothetical protein